MFYLIENATPLLPGLWSAQVPAQHFAHLIKPGTPSARYTALAAPLTVSGRELRLSAETAVVIMKGTGEEILFFDSNATDSENAELSESNVTEVPITWKRDSDAGFLDSCRALVGEDFRHLGQSLLAGFRTVYPGRLLEGKSRKWLNQPSNFVAITIQNRDRSFAVSIRDVTEARTSSLAPRADRPGYLRFKVAGPSDVPEATRLILASARRAQRS